VVKYTRFLSPCVISLLASVSLGIVTTGIAFSSGLSNEARLEVAERHFRAAELADEGSMIRSASYSKAAQLAEEVVAQDPRNSAAHFILFAARGRPLLDGGSVSVTNIWKYAGLNDHLTKALELDPKNANALAAKGGILLDLPSFLGGNPAAGRDLLVRALELNPTGLGTRVTLARALLEEGERESARRHLLLAAHYACVKREASALMKAEELLGRLDGGAL